MVSHLTVTPSSASGAPARAFNAPASTDGNGATDNTFAALLDHAEGPDKAARGGLAGMIDAALASLSKFAAAGAADGQAKDEQPADPQAIAAVIDAPVALQNEIDVKSTFTNLVKDLASLKQSLDAGIAIAPELLKRIDTALDTLGAKLDIDLSGSTSSASDAEVLKGLLAAVAADATTPQAEVTNALAPLIQALRTASPATTTGPNAGTQIVTPDQFNAVGSRLQALLQALNGKSDKPVDLAALGLAAAGKLADDKSSADLAAALTKLAAPPAKLDAAAAAPILAKPTLKLTEPTLTGKGEAPAAASPSAGTDGAQATKPSAVSAETADTGNRPDGGTGKGSDRTDSSETRPVSKPVDATTPPAPAAVAADKPVDVQPPSANQPVQVARVDAVAPRVVQAGYQTSQQQLNLPQIAFELVRQVNDGNARFQIRLDPPELGRIDVKLDIGASGQVKAHLIVDKAETLDLMQRDQRALERALQQAGLDSAKTNLEFSLRQNPFSGGQQQGRDQQGSPFGFQFQGGDVVEEAPPTINLYRASLSASGVNIIA